MSLPGKSGLTFVATRDYATDTTSQPRRSNQDDRSTTAEPHALFAPLPARDVCGRARPGSTRNTSLPRTCTPVNAACPNKENPMSDQTGSASIPPDEENET